MSKKISLLLISFQCLQAMEKTEVNFTKITAAIRDNNIHYIGNLIEKNPEILNTPFNKGNMKLLHVAAAYSSAVTEFLLKQKEIDINAVDTNNCTALNYAGNSTIIALLKEKGVKQYNQTRVGFDDGICLK